MVSTVIKYCSQHNVATNTVVDVGCGTGQSTFHWSKHFTQCIGVDSSVTQIQYAKENLDGKGSNIEFMMGTAEHLPLPDNSVDLISFGTSWHWMKFDEVSKEIRRVLRKPGCFAAYGYTPPSFSNAEGKTLVNNLMDICIFASYPLIPKQYFSNMYEGIPSPHPVDAKHILINHYGLLLKSLMAL